MRPMMYGVRLALRAILEEACASDGPRLGPLGDLVHLARNMMHDMTLFCQLCHALRTCSVVASSHSRPLVLTPVSGVIELRAAAAVLPPLAYFKLFVLTSSARMNGTVHCHCWVGSVMCWTQKAS